MSTRDAGKVTAAHLSRPAYLYVRQSTLRQVLTNTESTERQYALKQKAIALGWPAERVITIDTDQGHSGAHATDREGFKRLVGDVGMGRAGIGLGLEVSRLARNNADWQRLLEICALTDTLICDEDGLYEPGDFNDRLLLGLKGTMSEAELHFIRARLRGGQLSKARRGELRTPLPVGLAYDAADKVVLDPDRSVQEAIGHLFTVFARTGSARATVAEFNTAGLHFPVRIRKGPRKGELAWQRLRHWQVLHVLHNPRYAGVFVYGRRHQTRNPATGKTATIMLPQDQWTAFIPGAHPGYIGLEQFDANQKTLLANAQAAGTERDHGPAREGSALLQGLAICGVCGRRMTVRYHQRRGMEVPDYQCVRDMIESAGTRCQTVPGAGVDAAIGKLLLDTLTPLAIEVALTVQAEIEHRADQAEKMRHNDIERARHRAELARRRYLAVDPDNRLVADSLEADWNDALRAAQAAQDAYDKATTTGALDGDARTRIRALATDLPALWSNAATPQRERKRITRLLIEDVTLVRDEQIHAHVRLSGGQTTSLTLPIPGKAWQLHETHPDTLAALDRLLDEHTDAETAEALNDAGHRSGAGKPFTHRIVLELRRAHHMRSHRQRLEDRGLLTIGEYAQRVGAHPSTIKAWRRAGVIAGHKADDRNTRLFDPPRTGDKRLTPRRGSPLRNRVHTQPAPGGAV